MTMLFLKDRIDESVEILRSFEPPEGYYLAFSGGKDSVVLLAMAKLAGVKFDSHYNITTADPPELVRFIREHHPGVLMDRSEWTMWTLIQHKLMPPTRIARYCCQYLKERGGEGRVVLTGVKKSDSTRRRSSIVRSCRKNGKVVVIPLLNWCDEEIWEYIHQENLAYCELYDQGFTRLGCIGCPMGNHAQRILQFEKWPKYRAMYIKAFEKMLIQRGKRGLHMTWDHGSTAETIMAWWLGENSGTERDLFQRVLKSIVEGENHGN